MMPRVSAQIAGLIAETDDRLRTSCMEIYNKPSNLPFTLLCKMTFGAMSAAVTC